MPLDGESFAIYKPTRLYIVEQVSRVLPVRRIHIETQVIRLWRIECPSTAKGVGEFIRVSPKILGAGDAELGDIQVAIGALQNPACLPNITPPPRRFKGEHGVSIQRDGSSRSTAQEVLLLPNESRIESVQVVIGIVISDRMGKVGSVDVDREIFLRTDVAFSCSARPGAGPIR